MHWIRNSVDADQLFDQVSFTEKLPTEKLLAKTLPFKKFVLIYDQNLLQFPNVATWIKSFPVSIRVRAGENLKTLNSYQTLLPKILEGAAGCPTREICLVSAGGGSVTDFVGFVASTLKRGVGLVHFPSTWLAAIDSSHGGKTGLNVAKFKNQIGTYYYAHRIFIVRELLFTAPSIQMELGFGELLKIAILSGPSLFNCVAGARGWSADDFWSVLPAAVEAKYKIVAKDPFEKSGYRQILNLGHTFGHVIETQLNLPHGVAVFEGLKFAVEWSAQQKLLKSSDLKKLRESIALAPCQSVAPQRLKASLVLKALLQDKKVSSAKKINFVFLKGIGKPFIKSVPVADMIAELRKHKWVS